MSHTSSNDDSAQTVLPATAADADAAVTSGADVSSSDAATFELHSASVSLKFTPAAPVMSSSEEEEEEEEEEDEDDSDADADSDNEADSHDESDNGAASGDEAGDTTAAGVQESGEEGAAGKQESDLPDVGSLLNSINRRNASFRGRQQKDKEFRVKLIALDPDIHRRKRKVSRIAVWRINFVSVGGHCVDTCLLPSTLPRIACFLVQRLDMTFVWYLVVWWCSLALNASSAQLKTSSDFFKKNVTHVETPNLGQVGIFAALAREKLPRRHVPGLSCLFTLFPCRC